MEECDNVDNDCDGRIDEGVVISCGELTGALGVCSELRATWIEGEWTSCLFEDLKLNTQPGANLLSDHERCDCYDNNCNGIVDEPIDYAHEDQASDIDWTKNVCVPLISEFDSPRFPTPHCHIRHRYDQGNGVQHQDPLIDFTGTLYLGSLTLHESTKLWITSDQQSSDGTFSTTPGYSHSSIPTGCIANRKVRIGGDLTLVADEINIAPNATLTASTRTGSCDTDSSNPFYHAISGGSGGNIRLLAAELNIAGTVSAHGSAPNSNNCCYARYNAASGGAAGSIYLISPNLSLTNAQIEARGGRGICNSDIDRLCDNSPHAGGGPGSEGGAPFQNGQNLFQGAGSGGPNHHETDPERNIRIIGALSLESSASVRAQSGIITNEEGECDGHLLLSGGTLNLTDDVICPNEEPNGFINHQITLMPLDDKGRPVVSSSISMAIFEVTSEDNPPIISSGPLGNRGALTALISDGQSSDSALQPGGLYRLRVIDQDDEIDVTSVLQLSQFPNQSFRDQSLILEVSEMSTMEGITHQETLFIVPQL